MKATFSRASALAARELEEKLNLIKQILRSEPEKTPVIKRALKYIENFEAEAATVHPGADLSELTQIAKDAEIANEKELRLNRALKKRLEKVETEVKDLEAEISQAEKNLGEVTESRKAMKEKYRTFGEQIKRRESQWKEKYSALKEEVDAQD
jgi:septal ring factor EnvC (AmiA/AmiB activator)